MAIAVKWSDCICINCGQKLDDNANANTASDVSTGGLRGWHTVCPDKPRISDFESGWDNCAAQTRTISPEVADQLVKPTEQS